MKNLARLMTREEAIAGLEISDTFIRLALLDRNNKEAVLDIKILAEEPVPEGAIVEGVIKDQAALIGVLKSLLAKHKASLHFVIASIPADDSYAKVFSFPQTVQGEKLEHTIQLTMGFQLPMKAETHNLDWEKIAGSEENEILLSAAPKSTVAAFVETIYQAGLKPIAIESHPLSATRVLALPGTPADSKAGAGSATTAAASTPPASFELLFRGASSVAACFFKYGSLRFCRALPVAKMSGEALAKELSKLRDFYEVEYGPLAGPAAESNETPLRKELFADTRLEEPGAGRWAVALGAAVRGAMSRSEDNHISLLPVGTEQAYRYQKSIAFAGFLGNMTVAVAVFFIAAFVGVWLFMLSLQQNLVERVDTLNALPLPEGAVDTETRALAFNQLVGMTSKLAATSPRWSIVFDELKTHTPPGIIVRDLTIPSPSDTFTLTGTAENRVQLNLFRKLMEGSALFAGVNVPLTNLQLRENIPFTMTLRLRDSAQINYQK